MDSVSAKKITLLVGAMVALNWTLAVLVLISLPH